MVASARLPLEGGDSSDGSAASVDPNSDALIASIGLDRGLHPDFGTVWEGAPNGIPYVVVTGDQPKLGVSFLYAAESDPGPYPVPLDAPVQAGSDNHVLVVQSGSCRLGYSWFITGTTDSRWNDEDLDQLRTVPGSALTFTSDEGCGILSRIVHCDAVVGTWKIVMASGRK